MNNQELAIIKALTKLVNDDVAICTGWWNCAGDEWWGIDLPNTEQVKGGKYEIRRHFDLIALFTQPLHPFRYTLKKHPTYFDDKWQKELRELYEAVKRNKERQRQKNISIDGGEAALSLAAKGPLKRNNVWRLKEEDR